jgi:hypothetical protein
MGGCDLTVLLTDFDLTIMRYVRCCGPIGVLDLVIRMGDGPCPRSQRKRINAALNVLHDHELIERHDNGCFDVTDTGRGWLWLAERAPI